MNYNELLELYKTGKLENEEKIKVEADIERQDAISKYLFDRDMEADNIELDGMDLDRMDPDSTEQDNMEEADFLKYIRQSIRKTFIKSGLVVGTVVLVIVLFIVFAVPKIVDTMYYNPGKTVGSTSNGVETNQASLDLAVYSELFLHGVYRDHVTVVGNGNANYDILINQTSSSSGQFINVGGTINKGKMILFDSNLLRGMSINSFLPSEDLVDDHFMTDSNKDYKEYSYSQIDKLDEAQSYVAYVTLNKVMTYTELVDFLEKNNLSCMWAPLCFTNDLGNEVEGPAYAVNEILGFTPSVACGELAFNEEKYPLLSQFSLSQQRDVVNEEWPTEEDMTTHVLSLLKYMNDQDRFKELMNLEMDFSYEIKDLEENGIHTYGFVMITNKEELSKLRNDSQVDYISLSDVKYE